MSKKKRQDHSQSGEIDSSNPFAALGALKTTSPPTDHNVAKTNNELLLGWNVRKTRKGGWPLSVESRRGGKTITVLGRVEGDGKRLLKTLRRLLGTGGSFKEEVIEIQGDHRLAITAFLDEKLRSKKKR